MQRTSEEKQTSHSQTKEEGQDFTFVEALDAKSGTPDTNDEAKKDRLQLEIQTEYPENVGEVNTTQFEQCFMIVKPTDEPSINIECDEDITIPVIPRKANPYEDMPKKLDEVLGPIRAKGVEELLTDRKGSLSVYYEPGDYSVSGLDARVKLKPLVLPSRKIDSSKKATGNQSKPAYTVPGKPAKFPKQKVTKKQKNVENGITEPNLSVEEGTFVESVQIPKTSMETSDTEAIEQIDIPTVTDDHECVEKVMVHKNERIEAWLRQSQEEMVPRDEVPELIAFRVEDSELLIDFDSDQCLNDRRAPEQPAISDNQLKSDAVEQETLLQNHHSNFSATQNKKDNIEQEALIERYASPPPEALIVPKETLTPLPGNVNGGAKLRIGINGFERTGRLVLKAALDRAVRVVAINDAFIPANLMTYALKYDLAHASANKKQQQPEVRICPTGQLMVGSLPIYVFEERDANSIPWDTVGVDCVIETVEPLKTVPQAKRHLREVKDKNDSSYGGCCNVFLAGPSQDAPIYSVGANDDSMWKKDTVRCHTGATASAMLPVLTLLNAHFGGILSVSFTLVKSVRTSTNVVRAPSLGPARLSHTRPGPRWDFSENLVFTIRIPYLSWISTLCFIQLRYLLDPQNLRMSFYE